MIKTQLRNALQCDIADLFDLNERVWPYGTLRKTISDTQESKDKYNKYLKVCESIIRENKITSYTDGSGGSLEDFSQAIKLIESENSIRFIRVHDILSSI